MRKLTEKEKSQYRDDFSASLFANILLLLVTLYAFGGFRVIMAIISMKFNSWFQFRM